MSKRKRSWEETSLATAERAGAAELAAYDGDNFARPAIVDAGRQSSGYMSEAAGDGVISLESVPVDQPLLESSRNGSKAEMLWKPRGSGAAMIAPEALPGLTRKITACAACRKQKIKCEMPNDAPPCVRCSRRGLSCVLNKNLQTLLEETKQTELLQSDMYNLHEILETVCRKLEIPLPPPLAVAPPSKGSLDNGAVGSDNDQECEVSPPTTPSAVQAPIDTFLEVAKLGSPTSADTPQSVRHPRPAQHRDLVSQGLVPMSTAESLAHRYFSRLDHFLYGVGSRLGDLQNLRLKSPILVAAICTVSALHDPQDQSVYETCNREFRRLVSKSVFEKRRIDHLQALCIASFWLTDASRIFSSEALRRAADARLHKHFQLLIETDTARPASSLTLTPADHADRVRLWYLLFICDQHLSILHNRDPLLRTDKEITANWESFLDRDGATDSDVRLVSQVALLLIMGQVRDTFGSELDDKLAKGLAVQIISFSKQLDKWYAKFAKLFKPDPHIGDFPLKGLQMHYQYGKLYLGHHVFKGLKGEPIPPYFLASASIARDAAGEIFDMILKDVGLQQSLVGMPHYFHIMIAFAGHFLLGVCTQYHEQLSIDLRHYFDLIGQVITLFQNLPCIPQHPIARMTPGLARKLLDSAAMMNLTTAVEHQAARFQDPNDLGEVSSFLTPTLSGSLPTESSANFDPRFGPMSNVPDNMFFSDFEQFSFPDMTMNFMP